MNINHCGKGSYVKNEKEGRPEITSDWVWNEGIQSHKIRCDRKFLIQSRKKSSAYEAYCNLCGHVLFRWGK